MNKQRKVLITITYNEMGIIIDTKAEEVTQPNLQPTCNQLATDTISRQAAIKAVKTSRYVVDVLEKIIKLPSAQQEIIRCKDCKHKPTQDADGEPEFPTNRCPCQCDDFYYSWMPKDDWFCANAERREE